MLFLMFVPLHLIYENFFAVVGVSASKLEIERETNEGLDVGRREGGRTYA